MSQDQLEARALLLETLGFLSDEVKVVIFQLNELQLAQQDFLALQAKYVNRLQGLQKRMNLEITEHADLLTDEDKQILGII